MDNRTRSRRQFLKAGATAAGAVVAVAGSRVGVAAPTSNRPRWGFLIDLDRCIGCKACAVACKTESEVPLGVF
ncbi:MAG: 4Fe-4S binding protein [bacterium]